MTSLAQRLYMLMTGPRVDCQRTVILGGPSNKRLGKDVDHLRSAVEEGSACREAQQSLPEIVFQSEYQ
jgi:hypothetical protein